MYQIIDWNTRQLLAEVAKLAAAKRTARNQGHTGDHNGKYFSPVAYVADTDGYLVYNPRFTVGKDDDFEPVRISNAPQAGPRQCGIHHEFNCKVCFR